MREHQPVLLDGSGVPVVGSFDSHEYLPRIPVPITFEGIVIPPDTHNDCIGDECKFRRDKSECELGRHHLHSTEPLYETAGTIASEYRELPVLTVWLRQCRHAEHHGRHEIDVPVPRKDVMQQVIEEERRLRKVIFSQHELKAIEKTLNRPETTSRQKKGLNRRKYVIFENRQEDISAIQEIELIPEELIVGALLTAAPNHARSKILMGTRFVLTGTITKTEVPAAQGLAREVEKLAA